MSVAADVFGEVVVGGGVQRQACWGRHNLGVIISRGRLSRASLTLIFLRYELEKEADICLGHLGSSTLSALLYGECFY